MISSCGNCSLFGKFDEQELVKDINGNDFRYGTGESLKELLLESVKSKVNKEKRNFCFFSWKCFKFIPKVLLIKDEKEFACVVFNVLIIIAGFVWGLMFLLLFVFFDVGSIFYCIPPFCAVILIFFNLIIWLVIRKYQIFLNCFAFVMILLPVIEQIIMGGALLSGGMFLWCVFGLVVSTLLESKIVIIIYIVLILGFFSVLISEFVVASKQTIEGISIYFILSMFYMTLMGVGVIVAAALFVYRLSVRQFRRDVKILVKSFPKPIIRELRKGRQTIFHQATTANIMFLDMVDFTNISREIKNKVGPAALVKMMNFIFRSLDQIVESYPEVLKIKQLGDGAIYASGLFNDGEKMSKKIMKIQNKMDRIKSVEAMNEKKKEYKDKKLKKIRKRKKICSRLFCALFCCCRSEEKKKKLKNRRKELPCEQIVDMALECVEFFKNLNGAVKVRIGITTGDCVCGVIGNPLFFDIFGSTVNLASRMESSSDPMKIHITRRVVHQLNQENPFFTEKYETRYLGKKKIRGFGKVSTFYIDKGMTSFEELDALCALSATATDLTATTDNSINSNVSDEENDRNAFEENEYREKTDERSDGEDNDDEEEFSEELEIEGEIERIHIIKIKETKTEEEFMHVHHETNSNNGRRNESENEENEEQEPQEVDDPVYSTDITKVIMGDGDKAVRVELGGVRSGDLGVINFRLSDGNSHMDEGDVEEIFSANDDLFHQ